MCHDWVIDPVFLALAFILYTSIKKSFIRKKWSMFSYLQKQEISCQDTL
jgi:hypothetical protein